MADYLKPLPVPEVETEPFWAACKEHRLDIQQCDACNTFISTRGPSALTATEQA